MIRTATKQSGQVLVHTAIGRIVRRDFHLAAMGYTPDMPPGVLWDLTTARDAMDPAYLESIFVDHILPRSSEIGHHVRCAIAVAGDEVRRVLAEAVWNAPVATEVAVFAERRAAFEWLESGAPAPEVEDVVETPACYAGLTGAEIEIDGTQWVIAGVEAGRRPVAVLADASSSRRRRARRSLVEVLERIAVPVDMRVTEFVF